MLEELHLNAQVFAQVLLLSLKKVNWAAATWKTNIACSANSAENPHSRMWAEWKQDKGRMGLWIIFSNWFMMKKFYSYLHIFFFDLVYCMHQFICLFSFIL